MILEAAILTIRAGQEQEFEAAFGEAKSLIAAARGFRSLRLQHCVEVPNQYLMLIEWETLEDHTEGFRKSEAFTEWRAKLHHFYEPAPTVQHYQLLHEAAPA